ncbi:UNVERIFIED_CONTAM: 30S ribosomal protein S11, chloroplastic, partial [Sesamum indicum]
NVRIGSRKSARRIPKELFMFKQVSIIPLSQLQMSGVGWFPGPRAGTCGFKGTRRGTPFAAQTAASNAIRTVVDQGMQRAEVMIKGPRSRKRRSITSYS